MWSFCIYDFRQFSYAWLLKIIQLTLFFSKIIVTQEVGCQISYIETAWYAVKIHRFPEMKNIVKWQNIDFHNNLNGIFFSMKTILLIRAFMELIRLEEVGPHSNNMDTLSEILPHLFKGWFWYCSSIALTWIRLSCNTTSDQFIGVALKKSSYVFIGLENHFRTCDLNLRHSIGQWLEKQTVAQVKKSK